MVFVQTVTADETRELGQRIGSLLQAGDCLCLTGTLGVGKTLLIQGIVLGMGVSEEVTSPTFTILQIYQGSSTIYHYDLYRLNRIEELHNIGFEEYSGSSGVTLIEWADKFSSDMPEEALWIELCSTGDSAREIVLTPRGFRYETLLKELRLQ